MYLDHQLLHLGGLVEGTERAVQFTRPEDGEIARLQRQIAGLLIIDKPEVGMGMVGTVTHLVVGTHTYPLFTAQQQLDIEILLVKLTTAICRGLSQISSFTRQNRFRPSISVLPSGASPQ